MKHLSFEVRLLTTEQDIKRGARQAIKLPKLLLRVPKLLNPRRQDNEPSAPSEKKD